MKALLASFFLFLSAGSFSQIIELGQKSAFSYLNKLESKSVLDLVDSCCKCGHIKYFPADKISSQQKLVVGIKPYNNSDEPEMLYVVENDDDVKKLIWCGVDTVSYYLLDSSIINRCLSINF